MKCPDLNWPGSTRGVISISFLRLSAVLKQPDMIRCSWIIANSCLSLYLGIQKTLNKVDKRKKSSNRRSKGQ